MFQLQLTLITFFLTSTGLFGLFFSSTLPAQHVSPVSIAATQPEASPQPGSTKTSVSDVLQAQLYAYSSTPDQTNGNPFITASGEHVRFGIVANNCLPFGTKVRIKSKYGNQLFVVADRMATRYGCNSFDVWQPDRASAIQFGKLYAEVEVLN